MPMLGLGTWKAEPGDARNAVREALIQGYRHVDCAPIYGNEREVGEALSAAFEEGIVSREDVWITSKLWNDRHDPDEVEPALRETLANLQLDYIDLWLVHWPVALQRGTGFPEKGNELISLEELPLSKTWQGMEGVADAGLAKHIGVSNCSIKKLRELLESARIAPENNQVEMHPYLQQPQLFAFCEEHGIHVTAYSPLGSPDRPGMLRQGNDPSVLEDPVLQKIAEEVKATVAQVILAWDLQRGTITIPKSTNPQRIAENLMAAKVRLNDEHMATIRDLDRHHRFVDGSIWCMEGSPYSLENLWDE